LSGHFITFEGVDGCGKTTQRGLTAAWLRTQGTEVVETFEPGASALGAEIRHLLLSGEHVPVPEAELMLFLADRAQHIHEVLRPALERGAVVLCDRYTDSTRAYQLAGRQLNAGVLNTMLEVAELGLRPELTLWFDLPVSEALNRMRGRAATGEVPTRMDEERRSFHEAVRNGFSTIFEEEPERVRRVDASGSVDEVQKRVRKVIVDFPGVAV
jgi:dTMP kinase